MDEENKSVDKSKEEKPKFMRKSIIIGVITGVIVLAIACFLFLTMSNKVATYMVSFDSDGGTNIPSQEVIDGDIVREPSDPEKPGYIFDVWQKDGEEYNFDTTVHSDLELKATYQKLSPDDIVYKVSFKIDGQDTVSKKVVKGKTVREPSVPKKEGYDFEGWFLDDQKFEFSMPITQDIELIARFVKKSQDPQTNQNNNSSNNNQGGNNGNSTQNPNTPKPEVQPSSITPVLSLAQYSVDWSAKRINYALSVTTPTSIDGYHYVHWPNQEIKYGPVSGNSLLRDWIDMGDAGVTYKVQAFKGNVTSFYSNEVYVGFDIPIPRATKLTGGLKSGDTNVQQQIDFDRSSLACQPNNSSNCFGSEWELWVSHNGGAFYRLGSYPMSETSAYYTIPFEMSPTTKYKVRVKDIVAGDTKYSSFSNEF